MTYYNEGVSGWYGLLGVLAVAGLVLTVLGAIGYGVISLMVRPDVGEESSEKPAYDRAGNRL